MDNNQNNTSDIEPTETEQDLVEIDIETLREIVGGSGAVLLPDRAPTCGSYNV
jgi:hypothetical protein